MLRVMLLTLLVRKRGCWGCQELFQLSKMTGCGERGAGRPGF